MGSLRPRSREMEGGRWEDQNFQQLKKVQCLEEEEEEEEEEEDLYFMHITTFFRGVRRFRQKLKGVHGKKKKS